jgi:hypothetical protein
MQVIPQNVEYPRYSTQKRVRKKAIVSDLKCGRPSEVSNISCFAFSFLQNKQTVNICSSRMKITPGLLLTMNSFELSTLLCFVISDNTFPPWLMVNHCRLVIEQYVHLPFDPHITLLSGHIPVLNLSHHRLGPDVGFAESNHKSRSRTTMRRSVSVG